MAGAAAAGPSGTVSARRARVLLPIAGLAVLDYAVPPGMDVSPGDLVRVPLGKRRLVGVVWDAAASGGRDVPAAKLKPIAERLDLPGLDAAARRFIQWVAHYYVASANSVLRMALSVPAAFEPAPVAKRVRRGTAAPARLTAARAKVLTALAPGEALSVRALALRAGVSEGVVRGLVAHGALETVAVPADAAYRPPDPSRAGPSLSAEQQVAARVLVGAVRARRYRAFLLEGVTGSGKTEVYFEAIAAALAQAAGQVLVLVPEIGLTTQWLERFAARFGAPPVLWHSDLGVAERRRAWRAVNSGTARVVVGARSALFLPFVGLRLIVVDEEHDPSFKQEDGLCYNARDMAVVRAHLTGCPVVLASATPSLETVHNCLSGRYGRVHLPSRFGAAELPAITAVDMRRQPMPSGRWLSPPLVQAMAETLARGEQALLFLNRRGYAPLTLCRSCGERLECPQCTAWLVEHRFAGRLVCHHCGFARPVPKACPSCAASDSLV
ncbi:MAG: primosomal protein N', partial [Alphaproteobacteria bacterium]